MATCDATSIAILTDEAADYTTAAAAADAIVTAQNAIVTAQQTIADNLAVCIATLRALNNPADANAINLLVAAQGTANAAASAARALSAQKVIERDNLTLAASRLTASAAVLRPDATGATAGSPGTWTPPGTDVPLNLADVLAKGIVANPLTAWTNGQRVVTSSGAAVHWDGLTWVAGNSTLATGATAGTPGSWTGGAEVPVNLAGVIAAGIVANPLTAWTTAQRVVTRDGSLIHWDSDSWEAGQAP